MKNSLNTNLEEVKALINHVKFVNKVINEENTINQENVPYQKHEDLYKDTVDTCTQLFGARFDLDNPVMYVPSEKNIIVNGSINGWDNASFTFKLNDNTGNGCYIFLEMLQLNSDNIKRLSTIYSVYENWKQKLITTSNIEPEQILSNN